MRVVSIAILAVPLAFPTYATTLTGSELAQICAGRPYERSLECSQFVGAMYEGIDFGATAIVARLNRDLPLESINGVKSKVLGFCVPDKVTILQITEIVSQYVERNPNRLGDGTAFLMARALSDGFPCPQ